MSYDLAFGSVLPMRRFLGTEDNKEFLSVSGRRCLGFEVFEGDSILLCNEEGGQVCEIVSIDRRGDFNSGVLSTKNNCGAEGIKGLIAEGEGQVLRLRKKFEELGSDWSVARGIRLFGKETESGSVESFQVERSGYVIVSAPGEPMLVDSNATNTTIGIEITRKRRRIVGEELLPTPLSDPLQDIRVHSSTAESFVVRAGEYIQIIDVEGRQCTDFQCFSMRKLDKGLVKPLDVTTTRTISGSDYPMPGLFAKSFDEDMTPLVEVVQDTCGRHDAFGLACSAKYYDDMGYPGHVNCTDNFNKALSSYGVPGRKGWMAQNYFYNTGVDENGVLYFDEPWSNAGDYVLLRALDDLVCVSSACPDDTSPANGWCPTDIQVRTYSKERRFSRSIAYRVTPESEAKMTEETAFHKDFSKLTRDYIEYKGFWLPNSFSNVGTLEEYWSCRENAALLDLSALRKCEVTGPDSENLLNKVLTRNVRKLSEGEVVYSAMCYEHGGMVDDCTLFRMGRDNFRWVGGDEYSIEWMREVAKKEKYKVLIRSSTSEMHNLSLQGPRSREILKEIIWTSPQQTLLEELGWFRFTIGRIKHSAGVPVVVSRTGYTGELGYEIWCHPKDGAEVFQNLWEVGQKYDMKPMGFAALDMLRIEAGLIFYGHEFCEERDPFEAGIGFTVPLKSKEEDFIGRSALERLKANPRRKLVGLEIHSNDEIGHGDGIYVGRPIIGIVTSSIRSPILKKNIALAQVETIYSEIGTEMEIGKLDGHKKRVKATVVKFPHYDPTKSRVRA